MTAVAVTMVPEFGDIVTATGVFGPPSVPGFTPLLLAAMPGGSGRGASMLSVGR